MNREFLVLVESEVESRDAWISKNEAKMSLPPAGDAQDLEEFLQLKNAHDVSLYKLSFTKYSGHKNELVRFVRRCLQE